MFNSNDNNSSNSVMENTMDPHDTEPNAALTLKEPPYLPPSWEHYLDLLQDLCYHRNVLVAITAPAGAGKTTLMCQFIELIHNGDLTHSITHSDTVSSNLHICTSPHSQTCQVFAHSDLNQTQLLHLLCEGFGVTHSPAFSLAEQFEQLLTKIQEQDRASLLLIDNAENLPVETINALLTLLQYQEGGPTKLHIILFGSPSLQATLNVYSQDETHQRFLLLLPLTPFSLDETKHYIEQQSENNIFPSADCLTNPMIETIYKLSEGNPAKINAIAPRFLLQQDDDTPNTVRTMNKFKLSQHKLLSGLLIISLVVLFSFFLKKKPEDSQDSLKLASADEQAMKQAQTDMAIDSQLPTPGETDANNTAMPKNIPAITNTPSNPPPLLKPSPSPAQASEAPSATAPISPANNAPLPNKTSENASTYHEVEMVNYEDATRLPPSNSANPSHNKTKPAHSPSETQLADSSNALNNRHSAPYTNQSINRVSAYTAHESYLLHIGKENYTIKLTSLNKREDLRQLVNKHHLKYARSFSTVENNQLRYILVYGTYSSREAAQAEMHRLSASLKNLHPRVIGFDTVHSQIALAHAAPDLPARV